MTAAGSVNTTDDLAVQVAWLSYIGGYTQADIARRLSLSPAKVHRLIAEAHEAGYVHVFVDRTPANTIAFEDEIAARFGLDQCTVVPDVGKPGQTDAQVAAIGAAAARYLDGRIASGDIKSLGLSWGRSLAEMTQRLPRRENRSDMALVSLMGSLTLQSAINPFDVVYRLAQITGGQGFFLPVPFIADSVEDRQVLMTQRSTAAALERARSVDLCIVGIGAITADQPMFREAMGLLGGHHIAELVAAGAKGELVGLFLDEHGQPVDNEINRRTIGLSLDELRSLDVLAVAGGAGKAQAISAVLSSGVVNRLIVDEPAARQLCR